MRSATRAKPVRENQFVRLKRKPYTDDLAKVVEVRGTRRRGDGIERRAKKKGDISHHSRGKGKEGDREAWQNRTEERRGEERGGRTAKWGNSQGEGGGVR